MYSNNCIMIIYSNIKHMVKLVHVAAFFGHLQGDILWILICWIPPWIWPKEAETCRRFATRCISLYLIIVQLLVYIWRHRHSLYSPGTLSLFSQYYIIRDSNSGRYLNKYAVFISQILPAKPLKKITMEK